MIALGFDARYSHWEAKLYIGISLKWDYSKRTLDLSMPGYVTAALQRFRHQLKNTCQSSPHHHAPPTYGTRVQFAEPEDDTPLLPEERLKFIQQFVGVFLYYTIAIDNTILVALSNIGSEQARATSKTMATRRSSDLRDSTGRTHWNQLKVGLQQTNS